MTQIGSETTEGRTFNTALFLMLGVVFWLSGVLFIRFVGEALFVSSNPWLFLLFTAAIPASWGFVKITAIVGQVSGNALLSAVSLATVSAAVLDGIALTWFPSWYGLELPGLLLAAAWLLFGLGAGLGIGYWASR
jgi:hypothetical protein